MDSVAYWLSARKVGLLQNLAARGQYFFIHKLWQIEDRSTDRNFVLRGPICASTVLPSSWSCEIFSPMKVAAIGTVVFSPVILMLYLAVPTVPLTFDKI
jgi:hypothetical protein